MGSKVTFNPYYKYLQIVFHQYFEIVYVSNEISLQKVNMGCKARVPPKKEMLFFSGKCQSCIVVLNNFNRSHVAQEDSMNSNSCWVCNTLFIVSFWRPEQQEVTVKKQLDFCKGAGETTNCSFQCLYERTTVFLYLQLP
jgi:hypothetical protein